MESTNVLAIPRLEAFDASGNNTIDITIELTVSGGNGGAFPNGFMSSGIKPQMRAVGKKDQSKPGGVLVIFDNQLSRED